MAKKKTIQHYIIMGDSLSDRGTMNRRKLFGFIPMDGLSGLKGKSPYGRFNNQYSWDDDLGTAQTDETIIRELKRRGRSSEDISDDVTLGEKEVEKPLHEFDLDDDRGINYKGQDLIRNYTEGGLTAYDYSGRVTCNLKLAATEQILSTLDEKRKLLLQDDKARDTSQDHKDKSLIIEWSGANDLITVNENLSEGVADKAVKARIRNLEKLIKSGYTNFALFNLPDLSLTPRYKKKSLEEQAEAHRISTYFNNQLNVAVENLKIKLREENKDCSIDVFDVNKTFTKLYNNPKRYGFDPVKRRQPLTQSRDFHINPNGTSPGQDYMFWDDVHPTGRVQELLFNEYYKQFGDKYNFTAPHESLLDVFKETYGQKLADDKRKIFGIFRGFRSSRIDYKNEECSLETILRHALYEKGGRTRDTITQLGWINKEGKLISEHPSLIEAMKTVKREHKLLRYSEETPFAIFK